MKKEFFAAVLILCICGSVTFAISPMGPPTASLEKGQWDIGLDYSSSEIDLKLKDIKGTSFFIWDEARDIEIKNTFGKLAHGINDNWEISVDFGVSKSEYREAISWMEAGHLETVLLDYESDTSFAAQLGTKATLYENGPLGLGALFQVNWASLDGDYTEMSWTDNIFNDSGTGELDADIMVFKFAAGVSYEFGSNLNIYGGPLWQWIDGDGEADGKSGSALGEGGKGDIKQDSTFGGWIGFHTDLGSNMAIDYELQLTGSSHTYGFSLVKKF